MSELPPNFTRVDCGLYIVRTQAGFRQAIRDWAGKPTELDVVGFPRSYPALVSLSHGYNGSTYIQVNWTHLKKLTAALETQ